MAVTQTVYNEVAPNNSTYGVALDAIGADLIAIGRAADSTFKYALFDGTTDTARLFGGPGFSGATTVDGGTLFATAYASVPKWSVHEIDLTTGATISRLSGTAASQHVGGVSNGRLFTNNGNLNLSTWAYTSKSLGTTPPAVVGSRVFSLTDSHTLKEYTNDDSMTLVATYTSSFDIAGVTACPMHRCIRDGVIWFPQLDVTVPMVGFDTTANTFIGFAASPPLPAVSGNAPTLNPANGYMYQISSSRAHIFVHDVDVGRTAVINVTSPYLITGNGVPYDGAMWFASYIR